MEPHSCYRPVLEAPPPRVPEGSALWREYGAYREGRLSELKAGEKANGQAKEPRRLSFPNTSPIRWK